ncbi:sigma-70 family RNA polymerase sigma factor [Demequina iriomotensis]|uniref:sigma-70 family RNA polymerase sigma factor n=1 Tax=Demequina iriomotensis TaxID=1536641 RepID=UPI00078547E1|nr:sigma-70 family RNA polymerase sigma factor [Demequina iriomotensis]
MSAQRRERGLRAVPGGSDAVGAPASRPGQDAARLADLLVRSGRGDAAAFEELYDALAGTVHGLAHRIVRDPHLAEDVAQEALVEVWRVAARYRPDQGSARAWVMTIAHRRAVDRVRSEQSHADRLLTHGARHSGEVEHPEQVVDTMDAQWRAARVRRGLAALTPLQREALELTYYKGYTNRQLAESLGIPLGTAKARIRDAMIRLRDGWEVAR